MAAPAVPGRETRPHQDRLSFVAGGNGSRPATKTTCAGPWQGLTRAPASPPSRARLHLGLYSQWWWSGSIWHVQKTLVSVWRSTHTLTGCTLMRGVSRPRQGDGIVRDVQRQYEELCGGPPAGTAAGHPWSADTAVMMLLAECRDLLVGPGRIPGIPPAGVWPDAKNASSCASTHTPQWCRVVDSLACRG